MMQQSMMVTQSVWIEASPERVWQALTDKQQLEVWWSPNRWNISSLTVGGRVEFGEEGDYSTATIAVLDVPRRYELRWDAGAGFPELVTTYVLEAENGGTLVRLTESGFEALPDDVRQQRIDSTDNGYAQVMQDLKRYVEDQA